jgi:hypothetical protein
MAKTMNLSDINHLSREEKVQLMTLLARQIQAATPGPEQIQGERIVNIGFMIPKTAENVQIRFDKYKWTAQIAPNATVYLMARSDLLDPYQIILEVRGHDDSEDVSWTLNDPEVTAKLFIELIKVLDRLESAENVRWNQEKR